MTPKQTADLISDLSTDAIRESDTAVRFPACFKTAGQRSKFVDFLQNLPAFVQEVSLFSEDTDETFDVDNLPAVSEHFRIDLKKGSFEHEIHLFFASSISNNSLSISDFKIVRIADLEHGQQFKTVYTDFLAWDGSDNSEPRQEEVLPDPRKFCVDFVRPPEVPRDIRPWLLTEWPKQGYSVPAVWVALASRKLLAAISDRVSKIDNDIQYHFDGPPACSFSLSDNQIADIFPRLVAGAEFIFLREPRDADVRHLLLANEWARSYRKSSPNDLGENCDKSAAVAYSAYIKAKSSEMLSALSALRKNVLEETKQISEKGYEFARAMWKDLAVAAAPFVVKVISDAAATDSSDIAKYLSFAAAAFLGLSLVSKWFLNERWLRSQERARGVWRLEINVALTESEMKDIADDPISRSVFDYRMVGILVTLFYAGIVFVLVQYGLGVLAL